MNKEQCCSCREKRAVMVLFLFLLSVVCVITEGCRVPRCKVKNSAGAICNVTKKDINLDKNRFFAKYGNMNLTTPWTDRAWKIRFNIGMKRKTGIITLMVHQGSLPWKYVAKIDHKKQNNQRWLSVLLTCLELPKQTINVTLQLKNPLRRTIRYKRLDRKYKRRDTSIKQRGFSFTMDIDATRRRTKTTIIAEQPIRHRRTQRRVKKRRATFPSKITENCTVDLSAMTMTFSMKKPNESIGVEKCGVLNDDYDWIRGTFNETAKIVTCVTKYTKSTKYYTRIFYHDRTGRKMSIPCTFDKETLEPTLNGKNDVEIPSVSVPSASSQSSDLGYPQGDQGQDSVDARQTVIRVILLSTLIPLIIVVVVLCCRRTKQRLVINAKADRYPGPKKTQKASPNPQAMIVYLDEYDEHDKDGIELVNLLSSENINVVTLSSYTEQNMKSLNDRTEQMVQRSSHFIFIVTNRMKERTLKTKYNDRSGKDVADIERNLPMEYDNGTFSYTVTLIKNKFIRSLKCSPLSVNYCHLVSFEETGLEK